MNSEKEAQRIETSSRLGAFLFPPIDRKSKVASGFVGAIISYSSNKHN